MLDNQHWESVLTEAAARPTGGAQGFPIDSDIAQRYPYVLPDDKYRHSFQRLALDAGEEQQPRSGSDLAHSHSAGWLVIDGAPSSIPFFVADSLLAAIWLVRQTLGDSTLPPAAWKALVSKAQDLATAHGRCLADQAPSAAQALPRSSPPAPKRAAVPASGLPSKRLCSGGDSPRSTVTLDLSEYDDLAATPVLSNRSRSHEPASAIKRPAEQSYITKVTNHNRRAERSRAKKKADLRVEAKQRMGLAPPREEAPSRDHSAYTSISPHDEPLISWVLKQPVDNHRDLYSAAAAPYHLALNMLAKARSVGNRASQVSAAAFLRSWRMQGTPFAHGPCDDGTPALSQNRVQLARRDPPDGVDAAALASAWTLCDRYEKELDILHIKYRWAMAFLGRAYTRKIAQIRQQDAAQGKDPGTRDGRGKVSTEAMNALLVSVSAPTAPRSRQRFRRRLHQALRWYEAARQLGWGMLCLMPHGVVTNSWVENDLRIGFWHVWLELVVKVNPVAYSASKALDIWLGSDGLAGGPIGGKATLYMEMSMSATQVTEVDDSEDGDESDVELAEFQRSGGPGTPAETLQQLSLLELCKPIM